MKSKKATKPAAKKASPMSYSTPALEKGLDVIELLARQPNGLTRSQVARELARTPSEIFRMLLCLEHRGYIAPVTEDRYSLTLKLFKLAQEFPPISRLIAEALPLMNVLAAQAGQSCHLGILEAGSVVIVAQTNASTNVGLYVKLGSVIDLLESASGYVILAHLEREARAKALEDWQQATGKPLPSDLELHLKRIHTAGYEKRSSYVVKGVLNISFPILDDRGSAVAALTVPYLQSAMPTLSVSEVVALLRAAAAQITVAIGGGTTPA